ncbi:MAG: hypothetical protein IK089_06175, partial [Oxalobacter sp.]|nr:hypothetical protein [Oxalobacter sp.]
QAPWCRRFGDRRVFVLIGLASFHKLAGYPEWVACLRFEAGAYAGTAGVFWSSRQGTARLLVVPNPV